MYRIVYVVVIFQTLITFTYGQTYTLSGYVEDKESGEKIAYANIVDEKSEKGTISNDFGFFSLTLPEDSVQLTISFVGYQSKKLKLFLDENRQVNFQLQSVVNLSTVEISAVQVEPIEEQSTMSTITIPLQQIQHTPTLLGESDVLKTLQLLPGVQSGNEGQSGIFVRGGSPDQNLILLDGVPVYNASHLFGFVSVFNTDAVKDVSLIKGGFPARYAGRISSIVDIKLRDGNLKQWEGSGSIGLVSAKLTVEGPLKKDTSSLIFSARRSYIDILARPLIKKAFVQRNGNLGYHFYDVNLKLNYKFSEKNRIYWSFYSGRDVYQRSDEFQTDTTLLNLDVGLSWANITSAFRWNHVWSSKLFSNTILTYSQFHYQTINNTRSSSTLSTNESNLVANLDYGASIEDVAIRQDFDFVPNPRHFIRFGGSVIFHQFNPGTFNAFVSQREEILVDTIYQQAQIDAIETGLYVEDDWEIADWWKINAGIHLSGYKVDKTFYHAFQPRLSMRFLLPGRIALKASYAEMWQYIQLLTNEGVGLPTDLWLPTTDRVPPQSGWQTAIGLARTFRSFELSLEGYYRQMSNTINYKAGSSLLEATDWQDKVIQGNGEAYGIELLIQKKAGKLTGWLGYTLSWSYRQFEELNRGERYPFRYDRRHDFSIVASYKLSKRFRFSGNWIFTSGNPITLYTNTHIVYFPNASTNPDGAGNVTTGARFIPGRNNFRLGDYHRLDIGIDYNWTKKNRINTLTIGAYNAYNRKNPYYITRTSEPYRRSNGEEGIENKLRQFSLFPIIPSINYRLTWEKQID